MKKTILLSSLLFVLIFQSFDLLAQDKAINLIKQLNFAYHNVSSFSMEIEVKTMHSNNQEVLFTSKGEVKSKGNKSYSNYNGITSIINDQYFITIDESNKVILIKEVSFKDLQRMQHLFDINAFLDSTLHNAPMKYMGKENSLERIEMVLTDNHYDKITLTISSKDYTLRQVIYQLNSDLSVDDFDQIVIDYKNVLLNASISNKDFSETKYVNINRDKINPLPKYKDFEIIDQRQTN